MISARRSPRHRHARRRPAGPRPRPGLGGRVGSHAVADRDLGTLHVFTGLEIAAIPPQRAARLRQLSGGRLQAPGTGG
ncbi:hypothetical protein [Mangrovicoccus ximenensis]|uniref:hypothetical protein n=1 Tax=Mangrovicoccus ximenensis TaxID=1911570 RepID=UPI0011AE25CA|nr:hypothetical protein [Mangrovicoccus ximenensis]